ncbi:hypothetical protein V6N12_051328 [Hibiscus sabdariffa]|uniref:Uncharacterized protein n=1 Tax=Hibiscus sabdariffa TaxID=183260 RepID=A0ABR2GFV2_9ROSI
MEVGQPYETKDVMKHKASEIDKSKIDKNRGVNRISAEFMQTYRSREVGQSYETKDVMERKASEIDKNRGDKGGSMSMGSGRCITYFVMEIDYIETFPPKFDTFEYEE